MRRAVLFYDGECAACSAIVRFILQREPSSRAPGLSFAPIGGSHWSNCVAVHPFIADVDSMIWLEWRDGKEFVFVKSDAAIALGGYLGGVLAACAGVSKVVPRDVRDIVYDFIARRRYRLGAARCVIVTGASVDRFLD